jgi:hypothetical protein
MLDKEKPRKFQREYTNDDGTTDVWVFDLDKFPNGPCEVIVIYPKKYATPQEKLDDKNKSLPLTKRQWMTDRGKLVGYARAKALGLVK